MKVLVNTHAFGILTTWLIKIWLQSPRPWFYSSEYEPFEMSYDHGMPSGHSLRAAATYLTLGFLIFKDRYPNWDRNIKRLVYLSITILALIIGYMRKIHGVHTIDQILVGLFVGIIVHIICCYYDFKQSKICFFSPESLYLKWSFHDYLMFMSQNNKLFVIVQHLYDYRVTTITILIIVTVYCIVTNGELNYPVSLLSRLFFYKSLNFKQICDKCSNLGVNYIQVLLRSSIWALRSIKAWFKNDKCSPALSNDYR